MNIDDQESHGVLAEAVTVCADKIITVLKYGISEGNSRDIARKMKVKTVRLNPTRDTTQPKLGPQHKNDARLD